MSRDVRITKLVCNSAGSVMQWTSDAGHWSAEPGPGLTLVAAHLPGDQDRLVAPEKVCRVLVGHISASQHSSDTCVPANTIYLTRDEPLTQQDATRYSQPCKKLVNMLPRLVYPKLVSKQIITDQEYSSSYEKMLSWAVISLVTTYTPTLVMRSDVTIRVYTLDMTPAHTNTLTFN